MDEKEKSGEDLQADGQQESGLQAALEDKAAAIIASIPDDDPVTDYDMSQLIDEKLSAMEERLAAKFVEMGGIINQQSMQQVQTIEPDPVAYVPLRDLDYTL